MKIRSLAVDQFRMFTRPTLVEEFGDGINVIIGPNEMGKSTLLAAIRAVLFERHKSKTATVRSYQNDLNDTAPVVSLDFEIDGAPYRIEKRFIKSPYARLTLPDGGLVDSDEAEEKLQDLLGFARPGKTGASPDNLAMWSVLWVQQGESIRTPELPDAARSAIQACLETEVGLLTGGRRGQRLLDAVDKALHEIVDKREKPKGRYKEVLENLGESRGHVTEYENKLSQISEDLDLLAQREKELDQVLDETQDQADENEIDKTRKRREEAAKLQAEIAQAKIRVQLAQNKLETAEHELEARRTHIKAIAEAREATEKAVKAEGEASEQEKAAAAEVKRLKQQLTDLEGRQEDAEKTLRRLRRIRELADRQEEIATFEERHRQAASAHATYLKLKRKAEAIRLNQSAVTALRKATRDRDRAHAALQAAATDVSFDLKAGAEAKIRLDGEPLEAPKAERKVVNELAIEIESVGQILIAPSIGDKDKLTAAFDGAKRQLEGLLAEWGVGSAGKAERELEKKTSLAAQAESARRESQIYAPGDAKLGLDPGPAALKDHIESLRLTLTNELVGLELKEAPPRAQIEVEIVDAEKQAEALQGQVATTRAELTGPEKTWAACKTRLVQLETDAKHARSRERQLKRQLADAEAVASEDALVAKVKSAQGSKDKAAGKLKDLQAEQGRETVDVLDARIKRLSEKVKARQQRREELKREITGLRSRIQAVEGDGIEEILNQARNESEQLEEERARWERAVRVLTLLRDTLQAAEAEAKERYLAPVVNRIRPHLQILFPGSKIEIDEDFGITGIVRDGVRVEAFDRLSDGTREQIAVLARLAFGQMLIEQEKPATVILDDALVFSDDDRIGLMFDILNMAAEKMQIVVLTCRQRVFENLGGKRLRLCSTDVPVQG